VRRAPKLRDDQLDEDSLPPYPQLDKVLAAVRRGGPHARGTASDGFDPDVVKRAVALIDRAEYKRRQAPPACGCGRRRSAATGGRPITNRWRS